MIDETPIKRNPLLNLKEIRYVYGVYYLEYDNNKKKENTVEEQVTE